MTWIFAFILIGFLLGGCVCCGNPCQIFKDDFSGTLSNWTQDAGTWSIVSSDVETTNSLAFLRCNTVTPAGDGNMRVTASVSLPTNGIGRIIVGYKDPTEYHYCEILCGPSAYIKLFKRSSSTNTQLFTSSSPIVAVNTPTAITVCLDATNGSITYQITGVTGPQGATTTVSAGADGWALATGSALSGTAKFSAVTVEKVSTDCKMCGQPCSQCLGHFCAQTAVLTIAGMPGACCSNWNGVYHMNNANNAPQFGFACYFEIFDHVNPCLKGAGNASGNITSGGQVRVFRIAMQGGADNKPVVLFESQDATLFNPGLWNRFYEPTDPIYASGPPWLCHDNTQSVFVEQVAPGSSGGCDFLDAGVTMSWTLGAS